MVWNKMIWNIKSQDPWEYNVGHAIAQAGNHQPHTTEVCVQYQANPCGVCGKTNWSYNTIFYKYRTSDFPITITPLVLHAHSFIYHQQYIISAVLNNRLLPPVLFICCIISFLWLLNFLHLNIDYFSGKQSACAVLFCHMWPLRFYTFSHAIS